jgi:hypothetical protein
MPTITSFLSAPRLKALLALALTVTLAASESAAVTSNPFRNFIGQWSGKGQVIGSDGHRESMRCRAEYSGAKDGAAVNLAIVCASESFKFDIRSHVEASGESVQGLLDRNLSKRVRKSHRADRGEPVRRPDQLCGFHRGDVADIEWPNAGSQHSAKRWRRRRRAHRTPAARMSDRLSRRRAALRPTAEDLFAACHGRRVARRRRRSNVWRRSLERFEPGCRLMESLQAQGSRPPNVQVSLCHPIATF